MMLVLKSLQSSQVAPRKTTKRITDESNEVTKKNVSSVGVPSSAGQKSADHVRPTDHIPASIRNIHRLSTIDSEMTNGGRYVEQNDRQ